MSDCKRFVDYAPKTPPQGWMIGYTGSFMATLKILGELPNIPWGVVITFLVIGLIWTIAHTAIRKANNAPTS